MVRLFLIIFFFGHGFFARADSVTQSVQQCLARSPEILIYQPWRNDGKIADQLWDQRIDRLRSSGFRAVLIQWSSYQAHRYMTGATGRYSESAWLSRLVGRISDNHIALIFGLHGDNDFFKQLTANDQALRLHLQDVRRAHLRNAKMIAAHWIYRPDFKGWYLPEEIDDLHWASSERQALLQMHLQETVKGLRAIAPDAPVYLSTFFSGAQKPVVYAQWLARLSQQTGVVWLVQDGLGTNRMSDAQTEPYLRAISQALPTSQWKPMVEIFEQTATSKGDIYCPVSEATVIERRALWCKTTGQAPWAAFSLLQHMHKSRESPYQDCPPLRQDNPYLYLRKKPIKQP